jgi:antitoxin CcdA
MTALITVRIDEDLKESIGQYGINVSETVRRALQDEIQRKREEELAEGLRRAKSILDKLPDLEIVRAVRESRDSR